MYMFMIETDNVCDCSDETLSVTDCYIRSTMLASLAILVDDE